MIRHRASLRGPRRGDAEARSSKRDAGSVVQEPEHPYTRMLWRRSQGPCHETPADAKTLASVKDLKSGSDQGRYIPPRGGLRAALEDVTLEIREGDLGLVGESGSGNHARSRLLRLIGSKGEIVFEGQRIDGYDRATCAPCAARCRSCSRIPTARSRRAFRSRIVARAWRCRHGEGTRCARARVIEVLNEVGLDPRPGIAIHIVLRRPAPAHFHRPRADLKPS